jgi:predicted RNase H-like nuclease
VTLAGNIRSVVDSIAGIIAVDMPIGLPDATPRLSESEARRYLSPRGSTIFPTPVRACLAASDYRHACDLSQVARGVKISRQSWNILPKIAELDLAVTPEHSDRVIEAHPECSFQAMNHDRPLVSKHTAAGVRHRMQLVGETFGIEPMSLGPAKIDDVLDAYALLWTAERFARGAHRTFPADRVETDSRGLPMRIIT